jgi:hypothetical protein
MLDSMIKELWAPRAFTLIAVFAFGAGSASGQAPGQAASVAAVTGMVVDSLHRDYLRDAVLTVEGSPVRGTTDSAGRFRLEGIQPGVRRIEVLHPLLDTIGIVLQTAPLQLAAGKTVTLLLSTPSAEALVARKCTAGERSVGPAALLGTVQYAESEAPAVGARVTLDWVETNMTGNSVRAVPRRHTATVEANGAFRICGLRDNVSGTLIVANDNDSTSAIGVHTGSVLNLISLELPDPPAAPSSARAQAASAVGNQVVRRSGAVLNGLVLDPSGTPLSRARVSLESDSGVVLTGADGRFALSSLPTGTRSISVRRLGYEPSEAVVALHARRPAQVVVQMHDLIPVLKTVTIRAAARELGLQRVGFTKRKGFGTGYYLTPQEIEKRNAYSLTDLLQMAPMLRRVTSGSRTTITGRPSGVSVGPGGSTAFTTSCVTYFVDGMPWYGGGVDEFVRPEEVAAIETYSRDFTPTQFRTPGRQCETVVVWTKLKIGGG